MDRSNDDFITLLRHRFTIQYFQQNSMKFIVENWSCCFKHHWRDSQAKGEELHILKDGYRIILGQRNDRAFSKMLLEVDGSKSYFFFEEMFLKFLAWEDLLSKSTACQSSFKAKKHQFLKGLLLWCLGKQCREKWCCCFKQRWRNVQAKGEELRIFKNGDRIIVGQRNDCALSKMLFEVNGSKSYLAGTSCSKKSSLSSW